MALTANQLIKLRQALHRAYSSQELPISVTKPDADAAIAAADAWVDSVQAAYNAALPQPYRGAATADDKAVLLIAVTMAQRLVGDASYQAVISAILGELSGIGEV